MGLLSTDYTVMISEPGGDTANLHLIIYSNRLLPGTDTWTGDPRSFGVASGTVSGWNTGTALLAGPVGVRSLVLERFTASTDVRQEGAGLKNYDEGTFPMGDFRWLCISKS